MLDQLSTKLCEPIGSILTWAQLKIWIYNYNDYHKEKL